MIPQLVTDDPLDHKAVVCQGFHDVVESLREQLFTLMTGQNIINESRARISLPNGVLHSGDMILLSANPQLQHAGSGLVTLCNPHKFVDGQGLFKVLHGLGGAVDPPHQAELVALHTAVQASIRSG